MKFIADAMLGRLARQMRLLGYDVTYDRSLQDNDIIRISLEERRIILTRDSGLAKRPLAAKHFFVHGDVIQKQLDQIVKAFPPSRSMTPLSRCSICNEALVAVAKEDVKERVPSYVYETHADFSRCLKCGRTYWKGSHVKKMRRPFW